MTKSAVREREELHMIKTAVNSISAGILIAIGGSVYLACDNKYAGAALFSVALLCICYLGYYLFTGKIGYLATDRSKRTRSPWRSGLRSISPSHFCSECLSASPCPPSVKRR